ncbi:MAG: OmpA family protein [Motiliproteus sp.]
MNTNFKSHKAAIIGAFISGIMLSAAGQAQTTDSAPGYLKDSWGDIVQSGTGGCVHTGNWKPEMATIVGCDGISLSHSSELTAGQGAGVDHQVLMPIAVLFEFDSAELTEAGKQELQLYRNDIRPELAQIYGGVIVGHTDSQGSEAYNQDLSMRRSETVRDHLISLGASADQIVTLAGGEHYPIVSNDLKKGQQLNRRVAVAVTGELRNEDSMALPSAALFSANSTALTEESKLRLKAYADEVKGTLTRISKVEIVGHSDNRAAADSNAQMAQERAETVREYLLEVGVPADLINIRSAGADKPVASNRTAEGRAENRRVDIYLSGRAV